MIDPLRPVSNLSRRAFVGAAASASVAMALPGGEAIAQGAAKFRRTNITGPGSSRKVRESYKTAIRAMLKLPPADPRNWYRIALIHTMDCPHGNWWFLPWHRGFTGWFEEICRDLSGDPTFALPYWDWTANPGIPAEMFEDVLSPTNDAFIGSLEEFTAQFKPVLQTLWDNFSAAQIQQLLVRGLRFPDDLLFDIGPKGGPMFFDRAHARGITKENPNLDTKTTSAVSISTLLDALAPREFISFGSARTMTHSGLTGFGVLEGFPHNKVHNNVGGITDQGDVGGFMQSNLSPVDPLFFLHHSNIDRIWDVWTRKQTAKSYPARPVGDVDHPNDYAKWKSEPFLFFVGPDQKPVAKNTAGAYEAIGDFAYDYQPGSGEQAVPASAPLTAAKATAPVSKKFAATGISPAGATVTLPATILSAQSNTAASQRLVAKMTVDIPPLAHHGDFNVMVAAAGGTASGSVQELVGSLSMFGHHVVNGPVTFTVPLSAAVAALKSRKLLGGKTGLHLSVVPAMKGSGPMALQMAGPEATAELLSVEIEAL